MTGLNLLFSDYCVIAGSLSFSLVVVWEGFFLLQPSALTQKTEPYVQWPALYTITGQQEVFRLMPTYILRCSEDESEWFIFKTCYVEAVAEGYS